MAIKERLVNDERDKITKDMDDLDVLYIEKMREDGVDENLVAQFASLLSSMKEEENK